MRWIDVASLLGLVGAFAACSRTGLSLQVDASPDRPTVNKDAAVTEPDAAKPAPDAAAPAPDVAAPPAPDVAAPPAPDAAAPPVVDAVGAARDTTVSPPTDLRTPDVKAPGPDAAAGRDATSTAPDREPPATSPLAGGTFSVEDWNPAPTPDPACTHKSELEYFILHFGDDLATVNVGWVRGSAFVPYHGTLMAEGDKLTYLISDYAGGTLTIEQDQGSYVAQVTMFGSGVPVVSCLRAALSPQP